MSVLLMLVSLLVPSLDDAIKLDLKNAKYTPAFESGKDLVGFNEGDDKAFFYINGSVELAAKVPDEGAYYLTLNASCQAALKEFAKITITVNGKDSTKDFSLTTEDPKEYEFSVKLNKGDNKITIAYTNDVYKENEYDRNFYLHSATLKKK